MAGIVRKLINSVVGAIKKFGAGFSKGSSGGGSRSSVATVRFQLNFEDFVSDIADDVSPQDLKKIRIAIQKLNFDQADVVKMRNQIENRIFRRGLDSSDSEMPRARVFNTRRRPSGYLFPDSDIFRYRHKSGRLKDSLTVKPNRSGFSVSFSREKVILDSLFSKYGDFLAPSPSDRAVFFWLILYKLNLTDKTTDPSPLLDDTGITRNGFDPVDIVRRRRR